MNETYEERAFNAENRVIELIESVSKKRDRIAELERALKPFADRFIKYGKPFHEEFPNRGFASAVSACAEQTSFNNWECAAATLKGKNDG